MGNLKQYKGTKVVEKFMEMYISNLFLFYNIMWRIDGIQWNPVVKAGKVLLKKAQIWMYLWYATFTLHKRPPCI